MAIHIRLSRGGKKKQPYYRVVAASSEAPRDGRFLEILGTYDPRKDPVEFKVDLAKVDKWLAQGAKPTATVRSLLTRTGHLKASAPQ